MTTVQKAISLRLTPNQAKWLAAVLAKAHNASVDKARAATVEAAKWEHIEQKEKAAQIMDQIETELR